MKNRTYESSGKNGKFFCSHSWEVCGFVGRNWDLRVGVKIPCKCKKCGKLKDIKNYLIPEVPDHLIHDCLEYR